MQEITTFLTFDDQAEEAISYYTSIFENSRIVSSTRYGEAGPGPQGSLMSATFELAGQRFMALNGGPSFTFSQGISLFVSCETQEEVDELWDKLSEGERAVRLAHRQVRRVVAGHPARAGRDAERRGSGEIESRHEGDAADEQDRDRRSEKGLRVARKRRRCHVAGSLSRDGCTRLRLSRATLTPRSTSS